MDGPSDRQNTDGEADGTADGRTAGEPEEHPAEDGEEREAVLLLHGEITAGDVPRLCDRVREAVRGSDAALLTLDVGALTGGIALVEALARMHLTARRRGARIRLRRAGPRLRGLLHMAGLDTVLPVEPVGQPEQGEQVCGVQEGVERCDPAL